jgi:hypothetical protein
MVKFAIKGVRANVRAPIKTKGAMRKRTYEGALAYKRDAKSELFLLAVANMVAEQTFYEPGSMRDERFVRLIHEVTRQDPEWMRRFVPWLRNTAQMRSAAVQMAAEYVAAGGPNGRQVIASAMARADEPAEMLAYWAAQYGRNYRQPVKRGTADAVQRLFTEYAALKYDGLSRAWRMGDVIEMTHPKPADDQQSDLFRFLLDRRHHPDEMSIPETLPVVARRAELEATPVEQRRELIRTLGADVLAEAGATWEWLSGWLPGGMDAEAWEAVIPSMGYMALLRNLRNFDQAGISDHAVKHVKGVLANADAVAKSRQFPYRFWSAYKNVPSLTWASTLEDALDLSVSNVPKLSGRTLVLTDTSGSMTRPVSGRSNITHYEIAALFAAAVARKADRLELISFASGSERIPFRKTQSTLRTIEKVASRIGRVGHGTNLGHAIRKNYNGHDRVVVFSDMQTHDQMPELAGTTVFVFNTGGYRTTPLRVGDKGHYELGGFTDATFRLMALREDLQDADWPF